MHCFTHQDAEAIGVCHVCGRAVCRACVHAEVLSLTCSDTCAARQRTMTALIDFNSRNLELQTQRRIPLMSLFTAALGTVMLVVAVWPALVHDRPIEWYSLVMGAIFLSWAVVIYRATKRLTRPVTR